MRIFLTGATGYIGTALTRRLVDEGHEVRALVRESSDVEALRAMDVATFVGDVTDRYSLREGMSGADWVIHGAAVVDMGASPDAMERVNVEGSENVSSLAHKLGVGRFLSISSVAYFGGSPPDGSLATEESPIQGPLPSTYSRTKHEGERRIQGWAARGLAVTTVYPSLVYGPPGKRSGANALLRAFLKERFPVLVGGDRKTSWIYIADVVEGMVRVMEQAEPGRDYLLAGDVATVREIVREVCRLGEAEPPRRELSVRQARWAIRALAPVMRLFKKRMPVNREQLDNLARHWAFDDTRARVELSWSPRPLEEGLAETVTFLRGHPETTEAA